MAIVPTKRQESVLMCVLCHDEAHVSTLLLHQHVPTLAVTLVNRDFEMLVRTHLRWNCSVVQERSKVCEWCTARRKRMNRDRVPACEECMQLWRGQSK
jgi:hypothetical protein